MDCFSNEQLKQSGQDPFSWRVNSRRKLDGFDDMTPGEIEKLNEYIRFQHAESSMIKLVLTASDRSKKVDNKHLSGANQQSLHGIHASNKEFSDNGAFDALLIRLKLVQLYPMKIAINEILQVQPSFLTQMKPSSVEELVSLFLDRLMTMDYRAQYAVTELTFNPGDCKMRQLEFKGHEVVEEEEEEIDVDEFFSDTSTDSAGENETPSNKIHPLDIQMIAYHCADYFVRQYMFTKLALCQNAVPLIVPCPHCDDIELNLWSCREIKLLMNSNSATTEPRLNSVRAVEANVPMISFLRLSASCFSKSKLLNSLLNNQKHSVFFDRSCPGSTTDSVLRQGVVEISWYCPSNTSNDQFDMCLSFLNLHGDAWEHTRQSNFLLAVSSVIVVLVSDSDLIVKESESWLQSLLESETPVITLLVDKGTAHTDLCGTKLKIALKRRTEYEIASDLITAIRKIISGQVVSTSLAGLISKAKKFNLSVDEELPVCKTAKESACRTIETLKSYGNHVDRNTLFPLQGKLWMEWCKLDKSMRRPMNAATDGIENFVSGIKEQKKKIREEQLKAARHENSFIQLVVDQFFRSDVATQTWYIKWLRLMLDDFFSDSDKEQNPSDTFGFEHVLREIGQLYEASEILPNEKRRNLVDLAVELLSQGHPVELMDGDACYVPVQWISAILEKTQARLNDGKVFVISVLGLQSSGKSTLLNALFALQFGVGAGRCTRGAYMQLLRVADGLKLKLGFDFLLVIDTEGLQSNEETKEHSPTHDNELATFVIGLANLTIINIMGETTATIEDTLQVAVQAFLRMKQIRLYPRCVFVHQNVSAINAITSNAKGRKGLIEKLDRLVKLAAEQENVDINCFNDVIQFDVEKQTFYFAQLWQGSPPMAPPNPTYSQCVRDLRSSIFAGCLNSECRSELKLSSFRMRVRDLWDALQCENFVFSFRNSLEIAVYYQLETNLDRWCSQLQSEMSTLMVETRNKISNMSTEQLAENDISSQMQRLMENKLNDLCINHVEPYFSGTDSEQIIRNQWKQRTILRLEDRKTRILSRSVNTVAELLELQRRRLVLDGQQKRYRAVLVERSKALASELKAKAADDKTIDSAFKELWTTWKAEVSPAFEQEVTMESIKRDIERKLCEKFSLEVNQTEVLLKYASGQDFAIHLEKHVQYMKQYRIVEGSKLPVIHHGSDHQIRGEVQVTINRIDEELDEFRRKQATLFVNYSLDLIDSVMEIVQKSISNFNNGNHTYKLNKVFTFELTTYLSMKSHSWLKKLGDDYRAEFCPVRSLLKKKADLQDMFKSFCLGATETTFFVSYFADLLETAIEVAVLEKVTIDIARCVKQRHPAMSGNRFVLNYALLENLAIKSNFNDYIRYITQPQQVFKEFIALCVEAFCKDTEPGIVKETACTVFDVTVARVHKAIDRATVETISKNHDGLFWRDEVCRQLNGVLVIRPFAIEPAGQSMRDIEFIHSFFLGKMAHFIPDLREKFANLTFAILVAGYSPHEHLVLEQVCWEQCPFCKAICMNAAEGHNIDDHKPAFHMPCAVGGCAWLETAQFDTTTCPNNVKSACFFSIQCHSDATKTLKYKYKEYKKAGSPYNRWDLSDQTQELNYWKWFVVTYKSELEDHYGYKFEGRGKIPTGWCSIEREEVLQELRLAMERCR